MCSIGPWQPVDCAHNRAGPATCHWWVRPAIRLGHQGITGDIPASLIARYGAEAPDVIASARCERPTAPVAEGIDVTRAEFEFAVTHEAALDAGDILDRRTRIGLVASDRELAVAAAEEVLALTR